KIVSDGGSNAGLHRLADRSEAEPSEGGDGLRIRVTNDPGSHRETFELRWASATGAEPGPPIAAYVPPGASRVVRVPRPPDPSSPRSLRLTGASSEFANTLFLADERTEETTVLYIGTDRADDPAGLLYYLQRVFPETLRRRVHVRSHLPSAPLAWDSKSP